jgi:hypothetical protein
MVYRFKSHNKLGRKSRRGQTKSIRMGSRQPGNSNGHGSVRKPF